jgi:hypothetical protein
MTDMAALWHTEHLNLGRLLDLLEKHVAVAAAVPAVHDPLFGDDIETRYRKLRRQIAFEAMSP